MNNSHLLDDGRLAGLSRTQEQNLDRPVHCLLVILDGSVDTGIARDGFLVHLDGLGTDAAHDSGLRDTTDEIQML